VPGWRAVGSDDFNGDGKPDLIWQHEASGQVDVWYLNGPQGNSRMGGNTISGPIPGWRAIN
jgi:hypothetical protein